MEKEKWHGWKRFKRAFRSKRETLMLSEPT
jgi:hypothetical protein